MKSILFVLDYYIPHRWWVENVFENIIKRLDKKWYNIFVLTSKFSQKVPAFEEFWNVKIYRVGKGRISFMRKAVRKWKKILKENEIDIIHGSTYGWAIPAAKLAKKFDKKVILTVHEIFGKLWYKYKWILRWLIYKRFEKRIFKHKYDVYHCVSNNTEKELISEYKVDKNKVCVIHNWVDYKFWDPGEVKNYEIKSLRTRENRWDKFVFFYYGHAGKSKWIDYLVQALPKLAKLDNVQIVFNTRIQITKVEFCFPRHIPYCPPRCTRWKRQRFVFRLCFVRQLPPCIFCQSKNLPAWRIPPDVDRQVGSQRTFRVRCQLPLV